MTDFQRRVVSVLGLPFDVITANDAEEQVVQAMREGRSCFISTPNLNFLAMSFESPEFRNSVLMSDLSLADGKSIVLIARMLGQTMPERVAGSDLFYRLLNRPACGLRTFLFGGPDGVAQKAAERINERFHGNDVQAVGWHCPGFGTVSQMSSAEVIDHINASEPNFVLVALGAKKGQAWIQHNLTALRPCVISHLGAVVNFCAGTVKRAPQFWQNFGLEWVWRIKEEPKLWRRYLSDGTAVMQALLRALTCRLPRAHRDTTPGTLHVATSPHGAGVRLSLSGAWSQHNVHLLRNACQEVATIGGPVVIDAKDLTSLDAHALGTLQLLYGLQLKRSQPFEIISLDRSLRSWLTAMRADYIASIR
ncbi:WecB/TagA/CpsF family glycosyltransferase [Aquabacterium sp.]|uniref:WecB/TagA/CpsF family glycosyltransferase n=1 Tax=Aquabacterium sp. TaxID=1872578 RepID=UPI0025B85399|nr:WecB/TagA/CpsF family glycosyltransferase [Aquabacterium sp.]